MKIPHMSKAQLEKYLGEELVETPTEGIYMTLQNGLRVLHKSEVLIEANQKQKSFGERDWEIGDEIKFRFRITRSSEEAKQVTKEHRDLIPAMKAYKQRLAERRSQPVTQYIDLTTGRLHQVSKTGATGNRTGKLSK